MGMILMGIGAAIFGVLQIVWTYQSFQKIRAHANSQTSTFLLGGLGSAFFIGIIFLMVAIGIFCSLL